MHASKHDVALKRLSFNHRPILEGPNDSLDANRCEQGDFCGVVNEGGDLGCVSSAVLEKTVRQRVKRVSGDAKAA